MEETVKALKKECNVQGGALLIYKVIMNVAVGLVGAIAAVICVLFAMFGSDFDTIADGSDAAFDAYVTEVTESVTELLMDSMGWGYLLAIAIGLLILLLWKKPAFFSGVLLKRGKTMKTGTFLIILCVFLSVQLFVQVAATGVELLLNLVDLSILEVLQSASVSTDSISMLLYMCIAAPVVEEILFRGLILRGLEPYGKGFAIWASAILFGFFHGNPIQTPFAMVIGVILGYVTVEYNVIWAMILHMINNMIMGDTLPRLLSSLPSEQADLVFWCIILLSAIVAGIYAWVNRRRVPALIHELSTEDWQWSAILKSPCIIILVALSLIDMAAVAVMLIFM